MCGKLEYIKLSRKKKSSLRAISPGRIAVKRKLKPKDHIQRLVGRFGNPSDIAELAFYLCSKHSGFITGQNFVVDGGMTRKMIYV